MTKSKNNWTYLCALTAVISLTTKILLSFVIEDRIFVNILFVCVQVLTFLLLAWRLNDDERKRNICSFAILLILAMNLNTFLINVDEYVMFGCQSIIVIMAIYIYKKK